MAVYLGFVVWVFIDISNAGWWLSKHFWNFHPEIWGFMIQVHAHAFQMGGKKPPSNKISWGYHG